MIAANSMEGANHHRMFWRLVRFLGFSVLLTVVVILILGVPAGFRRMLISFGYGLTYSICMGGLGWLIMPRIGRYVENTKPVAQWIVLLAGMTVAALAGYLLALCVFATVGIFPWARYWVHFWAGLRFVMVISVVIGVTISAYETMKYRLQYEAARARLSSLESRLHRHFLFNTLNSISALIPENPAAAERMTGQLAALLRFSLDSTDRPTVPLEQELKVATDYLEIERTRFGPRLHYSVDVPSELMSREVPPFSLQTLIENSVKYGGGEIRISARNGNGRLVLNVWDSGPGFANVAIRSGHGLDNLRSRLAVLWGSRATLEFQGEDSGTSVRITLPAGSGSEHKAAAGAE
jgi:two-component system, LytTR family, sensor histidine kinase AlgZ